MIRIGFFGTPELSRSVLMDIVHASDMEVVCVVTNPDKPFGREQLMRSSPVNILAQEKNIPVLTPIKIRENREFLDTLRSFDCDYFVVVAYGRILPLELLEIPKKQSINIHGSILPKYRWASPIQSALLSGERETGVTIMEMSAGMDEGNILKIRTIPIDQSETSQTLFEKFAKISGPTLIQTLRELETGGITALPQNDEEATYCKKIEKEEGLIDWSKSAEEIYHMWQAYTPWPGIYTIYEGKRLLLELVSYNPPEKGGSSPVSVANRGVLLWEEGNYESIDCHVESHRNSDSPRNDRVVGQVIRLVDGSIGIQCSEWILTLERVKLEWKKSQSIKDFVNGNQKFISSAL